MSKDTLAVRVDEEMRHRLDDLAEAFGQTRSSVINEALRQYVEHQEWQVDLIRNRLAALDAGAVETVPHEDVLAEFEKRFAESTQ
ncbi:MAG: ribbon-helix-helix protein, CopG family [Pseudomonadota bacterium]